MTGTRLLDRLSQHERINFLLTNRIPRRYATLFMGWLSRIEQPLVRSLSFALWQSFGGDLRLHEAARTDFKSIHDCFTRRLKPDARPIDRDPRIAVSPCDAVVGAHGAIRGTQVFQAKGFPLHPARSSRRPRARREIPRRRVRDPAPALEHVPPFSRALRRARAAGALCVGRYLERQSDRAEARRAAVLQERARHHRARSRSAAGLMLVPVAAILVASIRLHCLEEPLRLTYRGPNRLPATPLTPKATRWAGSSTAPRFSSSPRANSRCATPSARAAHRDGPAVVARAVKRPALERCTDVIDPSQIAPTMTVAAVLQSCVGAMNERGCRRCRSASSGFLGELKEQRWDDHRLYHHSRINQSLHLVSALSFLTSYVLFAVTPASQRCSGGSLRCGRGRSATSSSSPRTSTR